MAQGLCALCPGGANFRAAICQEEPSKPLTPLKNSSRRGRRGTLPRVKFRDPEGLLRALAGAPLPAAVVDLAAFERNLDRVKAALAARPALGLRVGSKSLRVEALIARLAAGLGARYAGVLCYSARELGWLAGRGHRDLVMGYPVVDPDDARRLATARTQTQVCAMVDDPAHLAVLSAAAVEAGVVLDVAIDLDMAARWPTRRGPGLRLGVLRSPLESVKAVQRLAGQVAATPGLALAGCMGYDAQIAGLRDRVSGRRVLAHALVKAISRPQVRRFRAEVSAALRADGHRLRFFNGGGTGSLDSTRDDPSVTELTVGSGFLGTALFQGLDALDCEPALGFVLPVVRRPSAETATCAGGGYVASGAGGPGGRDRWPVPVFPFGLALTDREGPGEVQTPLVGPGARGLSLGDRVLFVPAKAGELAERFAEYHLVRGGTVEARAPTWRGDAATWG